MTKPGWTYGQDYLDQVFGGGEGGGATAPNLPVLLS